MEIDYYILAVFIAGLTVGLLLVFGAIVVWLFIGDDSEASCAASSYCSCLKEK